MKYQTQDVDERRAMYTRYSVLRDKNGLKDMDVSRETGIPASTLYDWKQRSEGNEHASLSLPNMATLASFFGVSIEYFTGSSND